MAHKNGVVKKSKREGVKPVIGPVEDLRKIPTRFLAALFGISAQACRSWHLQSGCPRNDDRQTYDLAAVIAWHEAWVIERLNHQAAGALDGSPGLEQFRTIKAQREEIALERDRGRYLARDEVHAALGRLAVILRGAGETLGRKFGAEAQAVLDEALDDFTAESQRSFGGSE